MCQGFVLRAGDPFNWSSKMYLSLCTMQMVAKCPHIAPIALMRVPRLF
jgi:hypothetical protein